jgi:hypothetical protein
MLICRDRRTVELSEGLLGLANWSVRRLRRLLALWMSLVIAAGVIWWLNAFGAEATEAGLVGVGVGLLDILGWIALILLPPLLLWLAWRMSGGGRTEDSKRQR